MRKLLSGLTLLTLGFVAGFAATSPLDPVRVAPHIYELAFENERVRVLKKVMADTKDPSTKLPWGRHWIESGFRGGAQALRWCV